MTLILKASNTKWWYIPTQEEKQKQFFIPWKFKLSWDWVFHTIQWEWVFTGQPTTFIRLNNCNLACSRCDARYTRKKDEKEYYESIDIDIYELYDMIKKAQKSKWLDKICSSLTFTWWEPLLQQRVIWDFLEHYWDEFTHIQIETNWTIPVIDKRLSKCYYNCSPKIPSSHNDNKVAFNPKVLQQLVGTWLSIFKFVFLTKEDIDYVLDIYKDIIPLDRIRFMPEWVTKEANAQVFENTIDYLLSKWVNVTIRAQNIMRDWAKRGV